METVRPATLTTVEVGQRWLSQGGDPFEVTKVEGDVASVKWLGGGPIMRPGIGSLACRVVLNQREYLGSPEGAGEAPNLADDIADGVRRILAAEPPGTAVGASGPGGEWKVGQRRRFKLYGSGPWREGTLLAHDPNHASGSYDFMFRDDRDLHASYGVMRSWPSELLPDAPPAAPTEPARNVVVDPALQTKDRPGSRVEPAPAPPPEPRTEAAPFPMHPPVPPLIPGEWVVVPPSKPLFSPPRMLEPRQGLHFLAGGIFGRAPRAHGPGCLCGACVTKRARRYGVADLDADIPNSGGG